MLSTRRDPFSACRVPTSAMRTGTRPRRRLVDRPSPHAVSSPCRIRFRAQSPKRISADAALRLCTQAVLYASTRAATIVPTPIAAGIDINALNFRYRIEGDNPAWRPLRAFDDGRHVFIEFPAGIGQGEMPPLWVIGPAGGAELVNYRVQRHHMIVDRLFAAAELRLGGDPQQKVRIVRTDGRPQS